MLMRSDSAQLLIVDMQERLLPAMDGRDAILDRCIRLVRAAQILRIPITVSEQYPKGLGATAESLRDVLGNDAAVLDKTEFSCFRSEALRTRLQALRRKGRPQIVLAGIESHICVLQTAVDLTENGFETFVAADATGSRTAESKTRAILRLAENKVSVIDTEMALFEWLGRAGTSEFKEIQALVK